MTDAIMPGRCAAPPAPATMTESPRPAASRPKAIILSGVRWAETTSTSCGMPSSVRIVDAPCMVGQSLSEPMTMATFAGTAGSFGRTSVLFGSDTD